MYTKKKTETLVLGAVLTALVIVLQLMGSFIRFGPFSISVVLVPIVLGAAICSTAVSSWLGFVFGVVVLLYGSEPFYAINIPGTVITVLAKGILCGLATGVTYRTFAKKNKYHATVLSALICPIVNTGVFILGCRLFFYDGLAQWSRGAGFGDNVFSYIIFGMIGANFLVEVAINVVLSPIIFRLINIRNR